MPFCENCGNKVNETDRFCENCGHSLSPDIVIDNKSSIKFDCDFCLNIFATSSWKQDWNSLVKQGNCYRYGIILTSTNDCPSNLRGPFYDILKTYINHRAQSNICYCVLDLAYQSVKRSFSQSNIGSVDFVVDVLKEISKVAPPQSLMIVGDRDSIPSIQWKNPLNIPGYEGSDSDKYVDSDLPFVTLDTKSPFENNSFTFKIEVGRIPSVAKTGFPEAQKYFNNVLLYCSKPTPISAVVLSAREWAHTSQVSYDINTKDFFTCPVYSFVPSSDLNLLDNYNGYNLLCFNLHGCPDGYGAAYGYQDFIDDYWLSGDGHVAYAPNVLPSNENVLYVISTEACYGAKPHIRSTANQSVLMTALQNRCIGYLGSTQIAYGTTDEHIHQLSLYGADIISGVFSSNVSKGYTIGSSYFKALAATVACGSNGYLTSHDIKTISSFALYGDPTISLTNANITSFQPEVEKHTHISMPDVKRAVEMKLTKVSEHIAKQINEYVKKNFAYYSDVTPTYYKLNNHTGYNVTFAKKDSNIPRILSMYLDTDGNIQKAYTSK